MRISLSTSVKSFCALGAIVLLAACSSGGNVQTNADGSTTVHTNDGTALVGGTTLPKDWPTDAPVYTGATVQYSMATNPANGQPGSAVILQTKDSADTVAAFYAKALKDNGWTVEGTMQAGGATIVGASKGDRAISIAIGSTEGQTTITIGVGKK